MKYIDKPYSDHPLVLFSDGKVYYNAYVWRDSSMFAETFNWSKKNVEATGVYEIEKDTIQAIIYVNFQCNFRCNFNFYGLSKLRECHFTGIIKNKDTITQWHMAPDLAGIDTNYMVNRSVYEDLTKPTDLYFTGLETKRRLLPGMVIFCVNI